METFATAVLIPLIRVGRVIEDSMSFLDNSRCATLLRYHTILLMLLLRLINAVVVSILPHFFIDRK